MIEQNVSQIYLNKWLENTNWRDIFRVLKGIVLVKSQYWRQHRICYVLVRVQVMSKHKDSDLK